MRTRHQAGSQSPSSQSSRPSETSQEDESPSLPFPRRFIRPDSDWLRKRAMTGAMSVPRSPRDQSRDNTCAKDLHIHAEAVPRGRYHGQDEYSATSPESSGNHSISDFVQIPERLRWQKIHSRSSNADEISGGQTARHLDSSDFHTQSSSPPLALPFEARHHFRSRSLSSDVEVPYERHYRAADFQHSSHPITMLAKEYSPPPAPGRSFGHRLNTQRLRPLERSPPEPLGEAKNWLLPHPFRPETDSPFVEGDFHEEIDGSSDFQSSAGSPSPFSTGPGSEEGRRFRAGITSSPGAGDGKNTTSRSPYFREAKVLDGTPRARRDSSELSSFSGMTGHLDGGSLSATVRDALSHSFGDFVSSQLSSMPGKQRSSQSGCPNLGGGPKAHQSAGNDEPDFTSLSPINQTLREFANFENQYSSDSDARFSSGPSVISRAVTQTLTPETSPYGQRYAATVKKQRRQNGMRTRRREKARDGRGGTSYDRYVSPSDFGLPVAKHIAAEFPLRQKPPDSSIISPLGHQIDRNSQTDLDADNPVAPLNRSEIEGSSILDLELDFSSESDSEELGDEGGNIRPVSNLRVNENSSALRISDMSDEQDCVVCAISESRSSDVIGVAAINVTMGKVDITRIVNDDRYQRLIETLWRMPTRPQTFLVLKKVVDKQSKSTLAVRLITEFPESEVVPLGREHWNESEGLRMINRFAWRKDIKAVRADLERNFYVSCAFCAVRQPKPSVAGKRMLTGCRRCPTSRKKWR